MEPHLEPEHLRVQAHHKVLPAAQAVHQAHPYPTERQIVRALRQVTQVQPVLQIQVQLEIQVQMVRAAQILTMTEQVRRPAAAHSLASMREHTD